MAATVSSFFFVLTAWWPSSNLLRIREVLIFSLDLKAGCLDRRFVVLFLTFRQMLEGTSKRAMNLVISFQVSLCNHQVIRPCKTWIKKESLKPQKIGHHDRFFMVYPNLFIYSFALWPSKSLGLLNNGSPFFPIGCLLSPSLNLHLPQILLQKFQPSRSRSNPSSFSLRFTIRFFINCPSLTGSYYMSGPFQYFFLYIYICY